MKIFISVFMFLCFLIIGCDNSTNPVILNKKLSDYDNNYNVLFFRGNDLYTIHSDSTNEIQLTNSGAQKQEATWSPSGRKITFSSKEDGTFQIYIMERDGTNNIKISQNPDGNMRPQFNHDGSRVIYYHSTIYTATLYSVNIDGTDHKKLQVSNLNTQKSYSVHPSENKIIFSSNLNWVFNVYEYSISDSSSIKLTNEGEYNANPVYSNSGAQFAFESRNSDGHINIFIMNTDGSGRHNLTSNFNTATTPVWSPDDLKILFRSGNIDNEEQYKINVDGSGLKIITNNGYIPSWSPDMSRISYSVNTDEDPLLDTIYIYDVETGSTMKLTDGRVARWSKIKL